MSLVLTEEFDSLKVALEEFNNLYRLHVLNAKTSEHKQLLALATESNIHYSESLESIGSMLSNAWDKIVKAIKYIWNSILDFFKDNEEEKELKRVKMMQEKVKEILKTANFNVKFDEVKVLEDSISDHFSYLPYGEITSEYYIAMVDDLQNILTYCDSSLVGIMQSINMYHSFELTEVNAQVLNDINASIFILLDAILINLGPESNIDLKLLSSYQIQPKSTDSLVTHSQSGLLDNKHIYGVKVINEKDMNLDRYKFFIESDPKNKPHTVKVVYPNADGLARFSQSLEKTYNEYIKVKNDCEPKSKVIKKTSDELIGKLTELVRATVSSSENPEQIPNLVQTFNAVTNQLQTLMSITQVLIGVMNVMHHDLKVYIQLQESFNDYYKS